MKLHSIHPEHPPEASTFRSTFRFARRLGGQVHANPTKEVTHIINADEYEGPQVGALLDTTDY